MEVKEAIEFLKNEIKTHKEILEAFGIPEMLKEKADVKNAITIYQEIITLLQKGKIDKEELKKVWQMWEDVKGKARGYRSPNLLFLMEELEQKYFPKGVKK